MGEVGLEVVEEVLPRLQHEHAVDLVIAQAENLSEGKGVTIKDFRRLQKAGVDFCTGGNWTLHQPEVIQLLEAQDEPIIRPANYPIGTAGLGYKYINKAGVVTLVISLLGHIVGKDSDKPLDNPLKRVDEILHINQGKTRDATIVNFHGDYSSEKVVIGHYLDGKVTSVVGDHWHIPTADAQVLPGGTAHITDVGMCGALDSSLGVKYDSVVPRWRDGKHTRNVLETAGRRQFNAVLVQANKLGLADSIQQIRRVF